MQTGSVCKIDAAVMEETVALLYLASSLTHHPCRHVSVTAAVKTVGIVTAAMDLPKQGYSDYPHLKEKPPELSGGLELSWVGLLEVNLESSVVGSGGASKLLLFGVLHRI